MSSSSSTILDPLTFTFTFDGGPYDEYISPITLTKITPNSWAYAMDNGIEFDDIYVGISRQWVPGINNWRWILDGQHDYTSDGKSSFIGYLDGQSPIGTYTITYLNVFISSFSNFQISA
tara:strand:- start:451 stop:807 length:357 start_codon:yes stop_codon:yes gene_type:complete